MSTDTNVIEKEITSTTIREPSLYKVLLHNDNTTTMDFVILTLVNIFHRNVEEAVEVTMAIHVDGVGIAGSPYTKEIAEEKVEEVKLLSRANGYPLMATFEEL